MIRSSLGTTEPVENDVSYLHKLNVAENLKIASQSAGDIANAAMNEVIPFKRSLQDGTTLFNVGWSKDENYDRFSDAAKQIYSQHSLEDRRLLNEANSLIELQNTSTQIKSANKDAELMHSEFGFAGSMGIYALAAMADPSTLLGYTALAKIAKYGTIAKRLEQMSTSQRAFLTGASGAIVEGSSELQIQSTGARDYEQVGYTALFASVMGSGGYAIHDMLSKSHIKNKQEAMKTLAEGKIDPKLDPESAAKLIAVFEQDKITPIRSAALKAYDNTIGKILNNKFLSSPMIEAWRKGGIASAIAARFDTHVGLSKNVDGTTIHNNADTAFDVKYKLYESFAKMEKSRLDSYTKHILESEKTNTKPMDEQQFSEHIYSNIIEQQQKYLEKKLSKMEEILGEAETMSKIREDVVKKLGDDDKFIALKEEEQNIIRESETNKAVSREAKERIKDTVYEHMDNAPQSVKDMVIAHNDYYKDFENKLAETGIDVDANFDSTFYVPRIYNQEAIAGNVVSSIKAITNAIKESADYKHILNKANKRYVEARQAKKYTKEDTEKLNNLTQETRNVDKELDTIDETFHNIEENGIFAEGVTYTKAEQKLVDEFTAKHKYVTINDTLDDMLKHPYTETLLKDREGVKASKIVYGRKRVANRGGTETGSYGGTYEKNYESDFLLTKQDVRDIRANKASPETIEKLRTDLGRVENDELYKSLIDDVVKKNKEEALVKLYALKKKNLKTKQTRLRKKRKELDKEFTDRVSGIDREVRAAYADLKRIEEFPKESAKQMVENILEKKTMSELDMDSLTPSRLKGRRMMINPNAEGMHAIMRTNEAEISHLYQYQTSGNIAVKHATGHTHVQDFLDDLKLKEKEQLAIDEAEYQKKLSYYVENKNKLIRGKDGKLRKVAVVKPERIKRVRMDKQDINIARDLFELTKGTRQIPNDPNSVWEKAVRRISQYNYITMGGQFAKYGLSEIGAGVYSTGFGYFKELVPALGTIVKMYRNVELSKLENDLYRMVEGGEIFSNNTRAAVSDTEFIESTFAGGIDRKLKRGSEIMFRYSGLEAITVLTKIALPRAFFGRIITQANNGKFIQPDLLRWGISPDDMKALSKENYIMDKNGKLEDFNFDGWKDQKLAERFQRAVTRMSRDTIMKPDGVRIPVWMTNRSGIDGQDGINPVMMLTKQFMTFTMLAHERLMLRGLNEKSAMAVAGTITSAMLLGVFAVLQEELAVAAGYQDKDKRKFDITTKEGMANLGGWVATRHSFAGQAGMIGETAVSLLNPTYRSGEQALTKVAGGATTSKLFSTRNIVTELAEGRYGTQNQTYFVKSLTPYNNMFIFGSVLQNDILNPIMGNK